MALYDDLMAHDGLLHSMSPSRLSTLQGEILHLFQFSPRHRELTLAEFSATVLPAIHFDQFRLYKDGEKAIGWVNWAYMTDEEASGYMAGNFQFAIDTWIDGPHLWFIDYVAPFGHAMKMANDLRVNVFPDQIAFAPDLAEDGSKRIRKFYGAQRRSEEIDADDKSFLLGLT